jgi:hypothetical protein
MKMPDYFFPVQHFPPLIYAFFGNFKNSIKKAAAQKF